MNTRIFRYKWLLASLVLFGLGFVIFIFINMNKELTKLNMDSLTGGPVWSVTSIEFDTLRLESALFRYSLDEKNVDEVRRSFDILWSRLAQLKVGSARDTLDESGVDLFVHDKLRATLVGYDDQVNAFDFDAGNARELYEVFSQFSDELRTTSLNVLQTSVSEVSDLRLTAQGIGRTAIFASVTVAIVAFLLLCVFAIDSVLSRRSLVEKEMLLQEAYAADIAKSQFISVINHELRTPLTSISASLALLKIKTLQQTPERISQLTEIAERNCLILRSLVDDLLDTERFASGNMDFHFEVVDLSLALLKTVEDTQFYAESYGVTISTASIEPNVLIDADSAKLNQLTANLLSNAIKFSSKGEEVEVSLETEAGRAVVTVKDHGRGIPENDLPQIFDRFKQVDSSDNRERGGTGLGLSIVEAIAEAHDAKIAVESKLGLGSSFIISFARTDDK